jgi:hypothetical protein
MECKVSRGWEFNISWYLRCFSHRNFVKLHQLHLFGNGKPLRCSTGVAGIYIYIGVEMVGKAEYESRFLLINGEKWRNTVDGCEILHHLG